MVDLEQLAERLDAEERLKVRYRYPRRTGSSGGVVWTERTSKLLDVEHDGRLLFVSQDDSVIWVKLDEAIEVLPDDGIYT